MSESPLLSLVLPCFNEAETLPWLVDRFIANLNSEPRTELILVNNGSTDDTANVLFSMSREPRLAPYLQVVSIEKNIGYGH